MTKKTTKRPVKQKAPRKTKACSCAMPESMKLPPGLRNAETTVRFYYNPVDRKRMDDIEHVAYTAAMLLIRHLEKPTLRQRIVSKLRTLARLGRKKQPEFSQSEG